MMKAVIKFGIAVNLYQYHISSVVVSLKQFTDHNKAVQSSTCSSPHIPLKSTSPLPSVSNMSITLCTSGFCWSSGSDMNSSTLSEPELSRSSFLNLFPSLLISSASTGQRQKEKQREREKIRMSLLHFLCRHSADALIHLLDHHKL